MLVLIFNQAKMLHLNEMNSRIQQFRTNKLFPHTVLQISYSLLEKRAMYSKRYVRPSACPSVHSSVTLL